MIEPVSAHSDFYITHWDTCVAFVPNTEGAKQYRGLLTVTTDKEAEKIAELKYEGYTVAGHL